MVLTSSCTLVIVVVVVVVAGGGGDDDDDDGDDDGAFQKPPKNLYVVTETCLFDWMNKGNMIYMSTYILKCICLRIYESAPVFFEGVLLLSFSQWCR